MNPNALPGARRFDFGRTYRLLKTLLLALALLAPGLAGAATVAPSMQSWLQTASVDSVYPQWVIVAFRDDGDGLSLTDMGALTTLGIAKGIKLQELGMVAVPATAGQVRSLAGNSAVRSIWPNEQLQYFDYEGRVLTGVDRLRNDRRLIAANNGIPLTGRGDFTVVVNDSGIDATHDDLQFNVVKNVQLVTDTETLEGFTDLVAVQGLPDTDTGGHGTHCAGIIAGTGQDSGTLYAGVAPNAKLIGVGSGAGIFILNALGGFEWTLAHQALDHIRVISNSWGTSDPSFDPDNPVNIASKRAHDSGITVLFAAGNSGPGKNTMNPYAEAPWVIGVAAGTKEGTLADFSSRGIPREERLSDNNPNNDDEAPTITAPGTGRAFDSDAGKFTSDIISTRAKTNTVDNGLDADTEIPTEFLPYYTQISGTSMATPHVAGIVALLLEADPSLTPDEIKQILQETATRMPGRHDYEVGAGYVNALAAVDKVFHRGKTYGTFREPSFNLQLTKVPGPGDAFTVHYDPTGLPGADSVNAHEFTVSEGMDVLDVSAALSNDLQDATDVDGNTVGILLHDPNGNTYSSGIALPILDAPSREVVVKNPVPGQWSAEVRGARGLTALPNVLLPTSGAAVPGDVDFSVSQTDLVLPDIADIPGHPAEQEIDFVLKNRMMDVFPDGTFRPDIAVTREAFANLLVLNTPLRQSLPEAPEFTDVSAELQPIAEAVTTNGSTLRDWNFEPAGMMSANGSAFDPTGNALRIDEAVALVRALGLDSEARAMAGRDVTATYQGQAVVVDDNDQIPSELRGYVQIALDRQLLQAFFSFEQGPFDFEPKLVARVEPDGTLTRAFMAYALDHFRQHFVSGN